MARRNKAMVGNFNIYFLVMDMDGKVGWKNLEARRRIKEQYEPIWASLVSQW